MPPVTAVMQATFKAVFAFRLGDGDVSRHTLDRLASLFGAAIGRRLTYKDLIA